MTDGFDGFFCQAVGFAMNVHHDSLRILWYKVLPQRLAISCEATGFSVIELPLYANIHNKEEYGPWKPNSIL
jgi:hypothetical protein